MCRKGTRSADADKLRNCVLTGLPFEIETIRNNIEEPAWPAQLTKELPILWT